MDEQKTMGSKTNGLSDCLDDKFLWVKFKGVCIIYCMYMPGSDAVC